MSQYDTQYLNIIENINVKINEKPMSDSVDIAIADITNRLINNNIELDNKLLNNTEYYLIK